MAKKPVGKPVAKPAPVVKNESQNIGATGGVAEKKWNIPQATVAMILLSIVALLVYVNSIPNGYVLDDVMVLKDNVFVTQGIKAIPKIFSTPHMRGYLVIPNDMYRPLSLAIFAVEYSIFGAKPAAGHCFNIVTYIGCILVFFRLIRHLLGDDKLVVAFVCALIFTLHPIHTEVVSNIKSRDELLCFLFAIATLNLFIVYMKKDKPGYLLAGLATLFLSYLSKETVVSFVAIIPFLYFFIIADSRKRAVFITGGSIVITVLYIFLRAAILKEYNANQATPVEFIDNALAGVPSAAMKLGTEIVVMGYYLRMMLIPFPLISNYSYNKIPFVGFDNIYVLLTLAAYGFMFYYAVARFIKNKANLWTFGILFYVATIALFSNFPFLMGAEVAERFTFFASGGACLIIALAFDKWVLKSRVESDLRILQQGLPLIVLLVICLPFAALTFTRNFDWKSNAVLYRADLAKSPDDSRLNYYLGTALAEGVYDSETDTVKRHEIDKESMEHLQRSLAIYSDYTEANAELGRVFYREGKYDSAEKHDKKTLQINPNHVTGNNNLGSVYLTLGRYTEAIALFRKTVTLDPNYNFAYFNMARAYMQVKNYDSAILNFRITLGFNPNNMDAQQEMGMAYYYKQNWDSASVYFKNALSLNPNDANAVNNLGAIYLNNKRYPEAIQYFQKALAINPRYINAASNLTKAYYFSGQYPNAIASIFNNLTWAPKYFNDFPYVALSYQKMGKMDSARKYEALAKRIYSNFKLE